MAQVQNQYVGDGSTVLFSFTFPYIEVSDIKVFLDGALTTEYSLANPTTVEFETAPAQGVEILIRRVTESDALKATFFPGSAIRAQDLNDNFEQGLFVAQETTQDSLDAAESARLAQEAAANAEASAAQAESDAAAAVATANQAAADVSGAVADAATAIQSAQDAETTAAAAEAAADDAVVIATDAKTTADGIEGKADSAIATANSASAAAAAAQSTANSAVATADAAEATALGIEGKADSAIATANTATITANNAEGTAQTALDTSILANDSANQALTVANNIDGKADFAIATAENAEDIAQDALNAVSGASPWAGDSSAVYLTDGNKLVGIGTQEPQNYDTTANNLVVGQATGGDNGITIASGDANRGTLMFSDDTTGLGEYAGYVQYKHDQNAMLFAANNSERVRITSDGNVGIGNSNPGSKLVVAGNVAFGPKSTTDQYQGLSFLNGMDSSALTTVSFIDFKNNLGVADAHIFANHNTDGSSDFVFGTTSFGDRTSDRRSEKFRISSVGNVGIGSSNPTAKLTVIGGNSPSTDYAGRSLNYGAVVETSSGRSGYIVQNTNNFTSANDNAGFQWLYPFDSGGDPDYKVFRSAAGTTLDDKFWVNQGGGGYFAGNVGIGESAPAYPLHIRSGASVNSLSQLAPINAEYGVVSYLAKAASGSSARAAYGFLVDSTFRNNIDAADKFAFRSDLSMRDGENVYAFYADGNAPSSFAGNIGIGTTNPQALIHAKESLNWNYPEIFLQRDGSNISNHNYMIGFGLEADTATQADPARAAYIGLHTNSVPTTGDTLVSQNAKLEISSPGGVYFPRTVGVGRSDADSNYKLDVEGYTRISSGSDGLGLIQLGDDANQFDNYHMGSNGAGGFEIWNKNIGSGVSMMSINSDGDMTVTGDLTVNGTINGSSGGGGGGSADTGYTNVKTDFGAAGNGTTDDTTAINNALQAGGAVYFPAGTYRVTSMITVTNKALHMYGDGQASRILFDPGTSGTNFLNLQYNDGTPNPSQAYAISNLVIHAKQNKVCGFGVRLHFTGSATLVGVCNKLTLTNVDIGSEFTSDANTGYFKQGLHLLNSAGVVGTNLNIYTNAKTKVEYGVTDSVGINIENSMAGHAMIRTLYLNNFYIQRYHTGIRAYSSAGNSYNSLESLYLSQGELLAAKALNMERMAAITVMGIHSDVRDYFLNTSNSYGDIHYASTIRMTGNDIRANRIDSEDVTTQDYLITIKGQQTIIVGNNIMSFKNTQGVIKTGGSGSNQINTVIASNHFSGNGSSTFKVLRCESGSREVTFGGNTLESFGGNLSPISNSAGNQLLVYGQRTGNTV